MKRCQFLLICLMAMSGASAQGLDSRPPAKAAPAASAPTAQSIPSGLDSRWKGSRTKAKLAVLKADVVKDVKDTSEFVQTQTPSRWLIGLAAFGLVMIQLRRKHKSLPQWRISPY